MGPGPHLLCGSARECGEHGPRLSRSEVWKTQRGGPWTPLGVSPLSPQLDGEQAHIWLLALGPGWAISGRLSSAHIPPGAEQKGPIDWGLALCSVVIHHLPERPRPTDDSGHGSKVQFRLQAAAGRGRPGPAATNLGKAALCHGDCPVVPSLQPRTQPALGTHHTLPAGVVCVIGLFVQRVALGPPYWGPGSPQPGPCWSIESVLSDPTGRPVRQQGRREVGVGGCSGQEGLRSWTCLCS